MAAVEEFFDLITAYHCTEDGAHLGIKKTLAKIGLVYECLTRTAVEGYVEFCAGCRSRGRRGKVPASSSTLRWNTRLTPLAFMTAGQVDLIDMNPHRDGQYQWIGHYTDYWSCFHFLFPLTSISAEEVAQKLCSNVLAVFGVPQTLFCNLGRQFTNQVVQAISRLWEGELDMDVGTQRVHNPVLDRATSKLEEMIAEYIQHRPLWTQWLPYVQYSLNTVFTAKTTKTGCSQSPYDILFNSGSNQSKSEEAEEEEDLTMEGGEYSEGEEDGEEDEVEGENLQLEVISDSITQTAEAPVWQMNVQPTTASTTVAGASDATPLKSAVVQATPTTQSAATATHSGDGAAGGKDGEGEDLTVQQILMPPDTDFLSSFYEAAQLSNLAEGNSRKRKRKQTPMRVTSVATPTEKLQTPST